MLLCDKVLGLQPATLRTLRQRGMVTVDYVNDNPFGPRRDPGWRLFRKTIPGTTSTQSRAAQASQTFANAAPGK